MYEDIKGSKTIIEKERTAKITPALSPPVEKFAKKKFT